MKLSSVVLPLAAAAITSAQDCPVPEPVYNITSQPFRLLVKSQDGKVDDTLTTCHVGAALESLCLSNAKTPSNDIPLPAADFYFNTSVYYQEPDPSLTVPGILVWDLPTTTMNVSSSAAFEYDPASALAVPIISPGSDRPTVLAFDSEEVMTIQAYVRGENNTGSFQEFYRWYACDTYYSSYQYRNLAWALGSAKPENPSCVAVNVTRVFVPQQSK